MRTMNVKIIPDINDAGVGGLNRANIEIRLQSEHEIGEKQARQIIDKYIEAERIWQFQNRLYAFIIKNEIEQKVK